MYRALYFQVGNYILIGSQVFVVCVLSCAELSLGECLVAETQGCIGTCVSGKVSTTYLGALQC